MGKVFEKIPHGMMPRHLLVGRRAQNKCLELQQLPEVLQSIHVRKEGIVAVPRPSPP